MDVALPPDLIPSHEDAELPALRASVVMPTVASAQRTSHAALHSGIGGPIGGPKRR